MPLTLSLNTKKSRSYNEFYWVASRLLSRSSDHSKRSLHRKSHSLEFLRRVFLALTLLVCSLTPLIQAQNFEMRAPREPASSNIYNDPSIVRTPPRTVGTAISNGAEAVQSANWETQGREAANAVKPVGFDHKSGYSLPFRPEGKESADNKIKKPSSSWSSTISMFVSLLIVIGLFLLVARVFRGLSPTPQKFLPKEVVQVIGRSPLAPRQQMYMIRFGGKLLLVSQQMGQTTTLSEIENPDEVSHLLGLCEQQSSNSISNSFRDVLQQITLGSTKKESKAPVRGTRVSTSQFESLG